jgi:ribokinase
VLGSALLRAEGGKGANQAVAAARAGSEVVFVGRVGDDDAGAHLVQGLQVDGVSVDQVTVDAASPTGTALISVDGDGENTVVVIPGANSAVSPADVERARSAIDRSSVVVLQLEIPIETVAYAAALGRAAGATVILNPAPAAALPRELLRTVDVLVPNAEEVARLSGVGAPFDPASAARMLLDTGAHTVVVTLGAGGAVIVTHDSERDVAPFLARAVDTTGAGDAFVGNLAHALDQGQSLAPAVRFASAAAALSVQREGAQPSMPRGTETRARLEGEA